MRHVRRIVVVSGAVALLLQATPASAAFLPSLPPFLVSFTRTPVGGPPGTTIHITGTCAGGSNGTATLLRPTYSDVVLPPDDSQSFTVFNDSFSVDLTNHSYTTEHSFFPVDAQIRVTCGFGVATAPFHGAKNPAANQATIFASLGEGICGHTFAPPGQDAVPCPAHIKGLTSIGGIAQTNHFISGWHGGTSIAVADMNSDGKLDIVSGTSSREGAGFNITDLNGANLIPGKPAYGSITGAISVAAGDVTGDGVPDVVTAFGPGGGPHVKVWSRDVNGDYQEVSGFMAYDPRFTGGVNVAVGDVDGDGSADIITGPGAGGGPHIRVFDWHGNAKAGFMAYDPNFRGGASVASGDLYGDTKAEIVTGAGPGGGPHVRTFDEYGGFTNTGFYAYSDSWAGGVWVAVGHATGTGARNIVTGPGVPGQAHIQVWQGNPPNPNASAPDKRATDGFVAFDEHFNAGARVAVAP